MNNSNSLPKTFHVEEFRSLARAISYVENEVDGYESFLSGLKINHHIPVIGVTGSPGAGKSTLINAMVEELALQGCKIAVLAVDPTSPFNYGSLLGDRIRMAGHFNNPNVFIRSLASRGALGGLSAKTIEICDVLRASNFDYILVETVGVGQSEVEIAGLSDITILTLVPEGGDEIQALKSGIMEIADVFVVNKMDRPNAQDFINQLKRLLPQRSHDFGEIPILGTVASKNQGIKELISELQILITKGNTNNHKKSLLLAQKAFQIMAKDKMKGVNKLALQKDIEKKLSQEGNFNLYEYVGEILRKEE